jgi:putative tryptophan/tyrosine transport system substrate-binding protein
VADAGESPTSEDAGGRLSQWRVDHRGHSGSIPPGSRRNWLCRRPKRSSRISLGRGRLQSTTELASELADHNVSVIAAGGGDLAARAAKAATSTIPIVFTSGDDPVTTGLVSSLARPGGNLTGVSFFVVELHAKRFELISELVPQAKVIALIVNPLSPQTERVVQAMQQAAAAKHVELKVLKAKTEGEIDAAFEELVTLRAEALIQQADPLFISRREQFALLAVRHSIPTIYEGRQFAQAGGLISYGPDLANVYYQVGSYVGKILKGENAGDLPVVRPTKFELIVNLRAAKAIGLKISEAFLLRADEVIE